MKVLIIGGTHGNEWTGVAVITHYADHFKQKYPHLDLHFILANPEAYKINRRFKDEDLNRACQFLNEDRKDSFEHNRARELKKEIDAAPCFVVDLHTTTSNMGKTVILGHETPLNLYLSSELSKELTDCKIIVSPDPKRKYLASQSDHGMMIEVGPVANGLLDPYTIESTVEILDRILDGLHTLNHEKIPSGNVEVYEEIEDIHYPQDENGQIKAYIHSSFQGKDFTPINGPYTPFKLFSGEQVSLQTKEKLYPIFINEAAYYPVKLAFSLCRKILKTF